MPGLGLIEKIVFFAIDLFVRNRLKREEYRRSFDEFFKKAGTDSQRAVGMHKGHGKIRKEEWVVKPRKDK